MSDVHIGSNSFISHSIIGRGSIIGHNFSSMIGKSTMEVEGEFKKLENIGIIVGADCNIGSHVVVDPGKIIGNRCILDSMNRIIKNVSSNSKVM
jgi:glucose-1-phosphate thymidylyltransferase